MGLTAFFGFIVLCTVAGTVSDGAATNVLGGPCWYNGSNAACNLDIFLGAASLIAACCFGGGRTFPHALTDAQLFHKAEFFCSSLLAFLWFVASCLSANLWSKTQAFTEVLPAGLVGAAQGACAFSFFSWWSWSLSAVFGYISMRACEGGLGFEHRGGTAPPPRSDAFAAGSMGYQHFSAPEPSHTSTTTLGTGAATVL